MLLRPLSHDESLGEDRRAISAAVETFGRLDIVVNLAAAVDVIRGGGTGNTRGANRLSLRLLRGHCIDGGSKVRQVVPSVVAAHRQMAGGDST